MSNRDIFAELVEGFETLAAEREGEKKHYWLVSYVGSSRYGGSVHGSITVWSDNNYFNSKSHQQAQANIPENCVFVSVSYLGEMTAEEWNGEE